MYFTTGTSNNIEESEQGCFDVFDYTIDNNNKMSVDYIDNGNDAQGIGIYAFIGKSEEAVKGAAHYTSEDSAYIYKLRVDLEEHELMNFREPDEIPVEELASAIEKFADKVREQKKWSREDFDSVLNDLEFEFETGDLDLDLLNEKLKEKGLDIKVTDKEFYAPSNFSDFYDFKSELEDFYDINEPCGFIYDHGGYKTIAQHAIDISDNLWEVIKQIGQNVSIQHSNIGTEKFNKTFQETFCDELRDYRLIASYVNNDEFAIIFDVDEIEVVEKIVLAEKNTNKNKNKINNKI